jgi:hypothetical protein
MSSESDSFLVQIRMGIEQRINEQLERHSRVTLNIDPKRVIDIQIAQEREKLEKALDIEESPTSADVIQALLDWLPQLAKELKGRF